MGQMILVKKKIGSLVRILFVHVIFPVIMNFL